MAPPCKGPVRVPIAAVMTENGSANVEPVTRALNVEAFEFGRSPGPDFTSLPSPPFHRGYAYRDYGNRIGAWRLLELFDEFRIPLAILANTAVYDVYPEVLVPFRERGDEFA